MADAGNWWDAHPPVTGQGQIGMTVPGQPPAPSYEGASAQGTYLNDADWNSIAADVMLNNGKGLSSIFNQSPQHEAARKYQSKIGEFNADIENTRRGVSPLVKAIEELEQTFTNAGKTVAGKAIGPNYGSHSGVTSWVLPDTSSQSYQNIRAKMPWASQDDEAAAALNNRLHHFKKGVATLFKAIPGSGRSGATDQAQATLEEMVDAAITSRTPEDFLKITHDAKNFLRAMGQQPSVPEPKSFTPEAWLPKGKRQQSEVQGAPTMLTGLSSAASAMARPRATNPQTGVTLEYDGQRWVRVTP